MPPNPLAKALAVCGAFERGNTQRIDSQEI